MQNSKQEAKILEELQEFVGKLFDIDASEVETDVDYFDLGIDSILIIQLKQEVKNRYDIEVTADQLFDEINTLEILAKYIKENSVESVINEEESVVKTVEVSNCAQESLNEDLVLEEEQNEVIDFEGIVQDVNLNAINSNQNETEKIIKAQLSLMAQQLKLLSGNTSKIKTTTTQVQTHKIPKENKISKVHKAVEEKKVVDVVKANNIPSNVRDEDNLLKKFLVKTNTSFNEEQREYLKKLVDKYVAKTKTSRELADKYRKSLANGRSIQGFTRDWKPLIYPILAKDAKGSTMWDVDGNEYIDFAMGFGANLFGYNDPEISKAIAGKLDKGIVLGAMTQLPSKVAKQFADLVNVERVGFCNSGTEAVMNMVRIARATTGKDKIVMFEGSFHGTFDGVYVSRDASNLTEHPIPLSLGTPYNMVKDVLLLKYGDKQSLEIIRKHADELAGILVEPIQSRNPENQPKEFLQELRKISDDLGLALMFDEVITGFRVHPQGAQAYFGIQADLIAYGKIIGGGLPIGIFAGKAKYMDRVDGGMWRYDDNSAPSGFLAHTGGTFCHHPLAMSAMEVVLNKIQEGGTALQAKLSFKTKEMATYINNFFEAANIPLKICYMSSLFIFKTDKDVNLLRFLYYSLIEKGIYIWEGGTCFISTVHTDDQIIKLVKAIQDSCYDMVKAGCYHFNISPEILTTEFIKDHLVLDEKKKYL